MRGWIEWPKMGTAKTFIKASTITAIGPAALQHNLPGMLTAIEPDPDRCTVSYDGKSSVIDVSCAQAMDDLERELVRVNNPMAD